MNPVPEAVRKFCQWAVQHAVEGRTSEGKSAKYVPHSSQSQYWTSDKIKEVTQSRGPITSAKDVQEFICIFSILVYMEGQGMSALHYLKQIMERGRDDATLPWTDFNVQHDIFGSRDNFNQFIDAQWMFFPMPARPFLAAQPVLARRVFMPNGMAKSIHGRRVQVKQIFPITEDRDRPTDASRATRRVIVCYMKIHSPSSMLESSAVPNYVVFKIYPPGEEETWEGERDGYTAIRDAPDNDNILQCLGSFYYINESGEQFSTIMSELADSGTLWDLFLGNQVPYRFEHVRAMWKSFAGALQGLAILHDQESDNGYICFHQDLKPSNFFLFGSDSDRGPFSYTIKIGDFGSCHAQSTNPGVHTQKSRDKGATRTYGPPETYLSDTLTSKASGLGDMWAIGCIIIELAVWITGGKLALDEFRCKRVEENKDLPQLERLGRGDCFHNGTDVLNCVRGVRDTIVQNRRQHDYITLAMVDLALEFVLIEKSIRQQASQLIPRYHDALRAGSKASINGSALQQSPESITPSAPYSSGYMGRPEPQFRGSHLWSPETPNFTQSPPSGIVTPPPAPSTIPPLQLPEKVTPSIPSVQNTVPIRPAPAVRQEVAKEAPKGASENATKSSYPHVTIQELQKWVESNKTRNATELRGQNETRLLLNGRDFIFLIDNSKYTKGYKEEVKAWTTSLAYLLKTIDPDGMDVANTSSPQAGRTIKNKTEMSNFVEQTFAREIGGDCMIENALSIILTRVKDKWTQRQGSPVAGRRNRLSLTGIGQRAPPSQGVTILVFTNGVWDATSDGTSGAGQTILNLIKWMQDKEIPRTQISIQFVRLGSEARGIRRLKILDDELKKDFDIVDTKPVTASIWDILIGPMQAGTDNDVATSS